MDAVVDLSNTKTVQERILDGKVVVINTQTISTYQSDKWPVTNESLNYDVIYRKFYDTSKAGLKEDDITAQRDFYLYKYGFLFRFDQITTCLEYMSLNGQYEQIDLQNGSTQIVYSPWFMSNSQTALASIVPVVIGLEDLRKKEEDFPIRRPAQNIELYQANIPDMVMRSTDPAIEFIPMYISTSWKEESGIPVEIPEPPIPRFYITSEPLDINSGWLPRFGRDNAKLVVAFQSGFPETVGYTDLSFTIKMDTTFEWLAYLNTDNYAQLGLRPAQGSQPVTTGLSVQSVPNGFYGIVGGNKGMSSFRVVATPNSGKPRDAGSILTIIPVTSDSATNNLFKRTLRITLI